MKARLTNNLGLKLLSIFLAFFVWLLVVNVSNPEVIRSKEIPVEIRNEEILETAGLTYEIVGKNTVTVVYSARTLDQYKINASDFNAYIDLADLSVTGAVPVTVEVVNNKEKIYSVTTKPQVLRVRTEELQRKRFMLEVITKGTPEEGYALGTTTLTPDYVYVKGPVSMVGQISNVGIEIDLENAESDLEGKATPVFYDANGNKLTLDERITVNTNEIGYYLSILKVKNLNLDFEVEGTVADHYKFTGVECNVKAVSVVGLKSVLASLNTITIPKSELNVQGATADRAVRVDLSQYLPQDVAIVGGNSEVNIVLKVEALDTRVFKLDTKDINQIGASDQYQYEFVQPEISVTVQGLKEDLESLAEPDLHAAIDLSRMSVGSHKGVLTFQTGDGFEITGCSELSVMVTDKEDVTTEGPGTSAASETTEHTMPTNMETE